VSAYDLALITTSQEYLLASVSTSAVLSPQRFIVLSFRDVTEKRILESELRKTKEFLERLIDSTVDGIIAADIKGNVVLFNRGASRITGYAPEEVIGKLPVWQLYPEGDAKRVMTELRSDEFGGRGRLLQSRQTVVGKDGQAVPVALSASIIYEGDEEVATVGVMSDLRERLHIEQKLLRTEERLAWSEKQAVLIELAGALAHELNQPLTSVMGYVQLLRRLLPGENSDLHEYAAVLEKEADRMAEIVRKIGHITRYETKSYVGQSRILDLDRSVWPSDPHSPEELELHHGSQTEVGPLFERLRR
jgi:PAS domain S-box-containing protein